MICNIVPKPHKYDAQSMFILLENKWDTPPKSDKLTLAQLWPEVELTRGSRCGTGYVIGVTCRDVTVGYVTSSVLFENQIT